MSKSKANAKKPNMAKFYKAEWEKQMKALTEEECASLTANLNKPNKQAGPRRVSIYDNVNSFVKNVVVVAEAAYDKAAKEYAESKKKPKSKAKK